MIFLVFILKGVIIEAESNQLQTNTKKVFTSWKDGNSNIYIMNPVL